MTVQTLPELYALLNLSLDQQVLIEHSVNDLAREFQGTFGTETIERFMTDSLASLQGARVLQFLPLMAQRFTRDRQWSLAKVEGRIVMEEPMVLFLCVHNAGRSQMAAGWLQKLSNGRVKVMTGGSDPAGEVNANAVAAMAEVGIDISQQFPKPWTNEVVQAADVVVTMGCGDACPIFPGKRYEDWEVADPAGQDMDGVRAIRDDLRSRVEALMASLSMAPELPPT